MNRSTRERARRPSPQTLSDPTERLVHRTRWQLAAFTLALVATLLVAVGGVTAVVAERLMHESIDRSLSDAAAAALVTLSAEPGEEGEGSPAASSGGEGNGGGEAEGQGGEDGDDGAVSTAPAPSPATAGAQDSDDRPPSSSDTFFLVLDQAGLLTGNPSRVKLTELTGLPDLSAVAMAASRGSDLRESTYGGVHVRLLTRPIVAEGDASNISGFLQAGFVLKLHDAQQAELQATIALAVALGLIGAAIVTLLVTRRALVPIRTAFATERRFVAAASHELRTPVAVVRASAEILQREDLVEPGGAALVGDIVAESDRLSRLVGDLLALASTEAGAMTFTPEPLALGPFVAGVGRRAESMADARGLEVTTALGPGAEGALVTADPDRFAQLLLILLENALGHSPAGGVVRLEVALDRAGTSVIADVSVSDSGPGVPVADRERIFEPFERLPGRPRAEGGSGLGLAIARRIADGLGASLGVDDAPGGGARFSLRIPARTR